jgi:hypothetical protein
MINERLCLIWRPMAVINGHYCGAKRRYFNRAERMQMSGLALFMIAVSGTAAICYWQINRVENRNARRRPAGDGSGDGASYDSGGDGWHVARWFGGDNSTSDNSGPSGDAGGGDSGSGDSGGGDGGGGGGD